MQQQRGFTLIELIIVIVILGILAVTAAPKFIDIQGDAKASTLQGVKAALQGGAQLVFAKSAIAGDQDSDEATVEIGTVDVDTVYGYPDATKMTAAMLVSWVDINLTNDFSITLSGADGVAAGSFGISLNGDTIDTGEDGENCNIIYTSAASEGASPTITVTTSGC